MSSHPRAAGWRECHIHRSRGRPLDCIPVSDGRWRKPTQAANRTSQRRDSALVNVRRLLTRGPYNFAVSASWLVPLRSRAQSAAVGESSQAGAPACRLKHGGRARPNRRTCRGVSHRSPSVERQEIADRTNGDCPIATAHVVVMELCQGPSQFRSSSSPQGKAFSAAREAQGRISIQDPALHP